MRFSAFSCGFRGDFHRNHSISIGNRGLHTLPQAYYQGCPYGAFFLQKNKPLTIGLLSGTFSLRRKRGAAEQVLQPFSGAQLYPLKRSLFFRFFHFFPLSERCSPLRTSPRLSREQHCICLLFAAYTCAWYHYVILIVSYMIPPIMSVGGGGLKIGARLLERLAITTSPPRSGLP